MDWIAILGAFGVGAIATKLLDVLWLQRVIAESERRRWLRGEKLRVYADLSKKLTRLTGLQHGNQVGETAIEAILLEEDPALRMKIEHHLEDLKQTSHDMKAKYDGIQRMIAAGEREERSSKEEYASQWQKERERLSSDARAIVDMLRTSLTTQ